MVRLKPGRECSKPDSGFLIYGDKLQLTSSHGHQLLHIYSPESEAESELILGEIDVFKQEHRGPKHIHLAFRPYSQFELLDKLTHQVKEIYAEGKVHTLTIVIWGHGNRWDSSTGYIKIFTGSETVFLLLDDMMAHLTGLLDNTKSQIVQLFMTQCWAHCHNTSLYSKKSNLLVGWLTSDDEPETSARRWDLYNTGGYMSQEEFEDYLYSEGHYAELELLTKTKYKRIVRDVLLKYLTEASIHIEATCRLYIQNRFQLTL